MQTIVNDIKHLPMREWCLQRSEALGGDFTVRTCREFYLNPSMGLAYGEITYSAGLAKIFDEAITNATDNYNKNPHLRDPIIIDIAPDHFRIKNTGATIPLIKEYYPDLHKEYYKPEAAFSVFQSSSNYDDSIVRTSNGKNGVGIKLANVFSKYFEINVINSSVRYHQTFQNNMDPAYTSQPAFEKTTEPDSVEIICYPDFPKLHIANISEGNLYHLLFRSYSCVTFGRNIIINSRTFAGLSFNQYAAILAPIYLNCTAEEVNEKYERYEFNNSTSSATVYVVPSKYHTQFSFVNFVYTADNGTHVAKLLKDVRETIDTTNPRTSKPVKKPVKKQTPTNFMLVFLNQVVGNPEFDGQAKNKLTSKVTTDFSELGHELKQSMMLRNYMNGLTSGVSRGKRTFYKKCQPANKAGTRESMRCTLFITEGDSATGMVNKGFSQIGHDYYGVYTLRGKVMNVRKATPEKVDANDIISNLLSEIGLQRGLTYTSKRNLRYGRIVMLKDADVDGDAIMGLVYNVFYTYFKPLLMIPLNSEEGPFFYEFTTPAYQIILPKQPGQKFPTKLEFTTEKEFSRTLKEYVEKGIVKDVEKSTHYMKGLGAIADEDVARYFSEINKHLIPVTIHDEIFLDVKQTKVVEDELMRTIPNLISVRKSMAEDPQEFSLLTQTPEGIKLELPQYLTVANQHYQIIPTSFKQYLSKEPEVFKRYAHVIYGPMKADNYMEMVYGKGKVNIALRKNWVMKCDPKRILERANGMVELPITLFQHLSNVQFALDNCNRSMVNIMDGCKPVYRKILYTLLSHPSSASKFQKITTLGGQTTDFAKYMHGEASLQETIFTMMRNWAGSNNIPLLKNLGGIGSRLDLGDAHAQPRYVETALAEIARSIYLKDDDPILKYEYEEGKKVEPSFYVPIIPMCLINGSYGIGTGFSNFIPNHNQYDCINYIRQTLSMPENLDELRVFPQLQIRPYYPECISDIRFAENGKGYVSYGSQRWIIPPNVKGDNFWERKLLPGRSGESPLDYNPAYLQITSLPVGINLYSVIEDVKEFINSSGVKAKKKTEAKVEDRTDDSEDLMDATDDDYEIKNVKKNCWPKIIDFHNNSTDGSNVQYEYIDIVFKIDNSSKLPTNFEIIPMKKELYTSNMYCIDEHGQIKYYNTIYEIMNHFMKIRFDYYLKRKDYILRNLENEIIKNKNKMRFIKFKIEGLEQSEIVNDQKEVGKVLDELKQYPHISFDSKIHFDTRRIKKDVLNHIMELTQFDKWCPEHKQFVKSDMHGNYDYITKSITVYQETEEEYLKLKKEIEKQYETWRLVKNTHVKDMWCNDLDNLEKSLIKIDEEIRDIKTSNIGKTEDECQQVKKRRKR